MGRPEHDRTGAQVNPTTTNALESPKAPDSSQRKMENDSKIKSMNDEIERVERVMKRTSSRNSSHGQHDDGTINR